MVKVVVEKSMKWVRDATRSSSAVERYASHRSCMASYTLLENSSAFKIRWAIEGFRLNGSFALPIATIQEGSSWLESSQTEVERDWLTWVTYGQLWKASSRYGYANDLWKSQNSIMNQHLQSAIGILGGGGIILFKPTYKLWVCMFIQSLITKALPTPVTFPIFLALGVQHELPTIETSTLF